MEKQIPMMNCRNASVVECATADIMIVRYRRFYNKPFIMPDTDIWVHLADNEWGKC